MISEQAIRYIQVWRFYEGHVKVVDGGEWGGCAKESRSFYSRWQYGSTDG